MKDDFRETALLDRVIARVADRMGADDGPGVNLVIPVVIAAAIVTLLVIGLALDAEGAVRAVIEGMGE